MLVVNMHLVSVNINKEVDAAVDVFEQKNPVINLVEATSLKRHFHLLTSKKGEGPYRPLSRREERERGGRLLGVGLLLVLVVVHVLERSDVGEVLVPGLLVQSVELGAALSGVEGDDTTLLLGSAENRANLGGLHVLEVLGNLRGGNDTVLLDDGHDVLVEELDVGDVGLGRLGRGVGLANLRTLGTTLEGVGHVLELLSGLGVGLGEDGGGGNEGVIVGHGANPFWV